MSSSSIQHLLQIFGRGSHSQLLSAVLNTWCVQVSHPTVEQLCAVTANHFKVCTLAGRLLGCRSVERCSSCNPALWHHCSGLAFAMSCPLTQLHAALCCASCPAAAARPAEDGAHHPQPPGLWCVRTDLLHLPAPAGSGDFEPCCQHILLVTSNTPPGLHTPAPARPAADMSGLRTVFAAATSRWLPPARVRLLG